MLLSDFDKLFQTSPCPEHPLHTCLPPHHPCFQTGDPCFQISDPWDQIRKFRRPDLACTCPRDRRSLRRTRGGLWRTERRPRTCWRARIRSCISKRLSGPSSFRRPRCCSDTRSESIRFSLQRNSGLTRNKNCRSAFFEEDIFLLWRS